MTVEICRAINFKIAVNGVEFMKLIIEVKKWKLLIYISNEKVIVSICRIIIKLTLSINMKLAYFFTSIHQDNTITLREYLN